MLTVHLASVAEYLNLQKSAEFARAKSALDVLRATYRPALIQEFQGQLATELLRTVELGTGEQATIFAPGMQALTPNDGQEPRAPKKR